MRINPAGNQPLFGMKKNNPQTENTTINITTSPIKDSFSKSSSLQEKISIDEGAGLILKGFGSKIKEIAKTIVKHPIKTAGIVAGTTLALAALPLIGISSLVGASVLTIGFGALAIGKAVSHTYKAITNNKTGEYDKARQNLRDLGGDTLDLALALPFIPKSLQQIKNQFKYSAGIQYNKALFDTLKNTKGLLPKLKELSKADLKILYGQHINQKGLTVAPELKFMEMPMKNMAAMNPKTGEMLVDSRGLNILSTNKYNGLLKHELTHFDQFSTVARAEKVVMDGQKMSGFDALKKSCIEKADKAKKMMDENMKMTREVLEDLKSSPSKGRFEKLFTTKMRENIERGIKFSKQQDFSPTINETFWKNVIKENGGIIKEGTQEAQKAQEYLNAWTNYPTSPMLEPFKYFSNLLEKEAYKLQGEFMKNRAGSGQNLKQIISRSSNNN